MTTKAKKPSGLADVAWAALERRAQSEPDYDEDWIESLRAARKAATERFLQLSEAEQDEELADIERFVQRFMARQEHVSVRWEELRQNPIVREPGETSDMLYARTYKALMAGYPEKPATRGAANMKSAKGDSEKPTRPDRADKRLITAHVEPEVYREFKVLAAQRGMTTDLMLTKALALLFDNYGEKPPAAIRRKLADHKL